MNDPQWLTDIQTLVDWFVEVLLHRKHRPGPPRHVHVRETLMANVKVTWTKSLTGTPTEYDVQWIRNGTPAATVHHAVSTSENTSGYANDFITDNPGVPLNDGDVIGAAVQAVDTVNSLSSALVNGGNVTIPTPPPPPPAPGDPQNVVTALV